MATTTWRKTPIRRNQLLATVALAAVGLAVLPGGQPGALSSHVLTLDGSKWGDKDTDAIGKDGDVANHPDKDPGSLYVVSRAIHARDLWKATDASGQKITGAGVTVALLDSGVTPVPGLNGAGHVVYGPDFSTADGTNTGNVDAYGHGTFMAGIIAADDHPISSDGKPIALDGAKPEVQEGIAPNARVLSLKLAGADGSTSVDAVIAGLAWVVQHKDDNGMHVRVINLSFGARALQPYQQDPLAAAVENAWKAGIVVVASAGNEGPLSGGLDDPALDPYVISVGSSDPQLRVDGWASGHAIVAGFSNAGTTVRPVDLLAPGRSVAGLRVPGSTIDTLYPGGRIVGDTTGRLFRGSGTSQAAAVVSGTVALLLQARPSLTPDQVKALLKATASPIAGADVRLAGAGEINVAAVMSLSEKVGSSDPTAIAVAGAVQTWQPSTGLVGLLPGDITGHWEGAKWSGAKWSGAKWSGAKWSGAKWSGNTW